MPADVSLDEALVRLDGWLCELKDRQIRDGLHVYGQSPTGRQERDLLVALARVLWRRGAGWSLGLLLALLSAAMALPGCATFQAQPVALQKAEKDALACGVTGVQQALTKLTPDVLDALAGDTPDWRAQLDGLKGVGANVLLCAVSHALYDALGGDVAQFATVYDLERGVELRLAVASDEVVPLPTPTRRVLARGLSYLRERLPEATSPPRPPGK